MFSSKCISPGFSRFLSASTTHIAHSLKGSPAVIIPAVETVQSPPATLTNHSVSRLLPTGNMIATTKHFGKSKKRLSSGLNIEEDPLLVLCRIAFIEGFWRCKLLNLRNSFNIKTLAVYMSLSKCLSFRI